MRDSVGKFGAADGEIIFTQLEKGESFDLTGENKPNILIYYMICMCKMIISLERGDRKRKI